MSMYSLIRLGLAGVLLPGLILAQESAPPSPALQLPSYGVGESKATGESSVGRTDETPPVTQARIERSTRRLQQSEPGADEKFPSGVSPTRVYVALDLLDRRVDAIMQATKTPVPAPTKTVETRVQPLHVYQMVLACVDRFARLDTTSPEARRLAKGGAESQVPLPSALPAPGLVDVCVQMQIIIAEINLLKIDLGTSSSTPLPVPVTGKSASDVHSQMRLANLLLSQVPSRRRVGHQANESHKINN